MNLQPARCHLRQIENLINQVAKVIGRCFDALDRLHLTRSKLSVYAFAKKVDKTDNSIERSTKLVRHVREELALHPVHAQQFRGKPLQLFGAFHKTPSLSALVAHTAWHWLAERWELLRKFRFEWPAIDAAFLAGALRWMMLLVVAAGLYWLVFGVLKPPRDGQGVESLKSEV